MKKVLLLQRKYTDNLGDVAIGRSMCYLLESHGCTVFHHEFCSLSRTNVIDTSDKNDNTIKAQRSFSLERLPSLLRKYYWLFRHRALFANVMFLHFDKIVIGGGELVQSGNFCFALYWWTRLLKLFQPRTGIYLFSVGVFDRWTVFEKNLISSALRRISCVYVRDEKSAENLMTFFNRKSIVVPDSVFVNPVEDGIPNNRVLYGITPFSRFLWHSKIALYTDIDTYYNNCHCDIENYLASGKDVSLFYTTKADFNSCVSFNQYCVEEFGVSYPIESIHTLEDLISAIKNSGIVVSARMHACILATLFSKRVIPILLSEKMKSFNNRYMNRDEAYYKDLANSLNSALSEVVKN